MEMLQDPRPKKTSFLTGLFIQIAAMVLIILAFATGWGWLIILLQAWIVLILFAGVSTVFLNTDLTNCRLRWEQSWLYPSLNIFLYGIMSGDPIFTSLYFAGIAMLYIKYGGQIQKVDYEYTRKKCSKV